MNANNVYRNYAVMCPEFREGIAYLAEGDHEKALDAFAIADHKTARDDVNKNKYQSFHGLLLVYAGQLISKGVEQKTACLMSMVMPLTDDPDMLDSLNATISTIFE